MRERGGREEVLRDGNGGYFGPSLDELWKVADFGVYGLEITGKRRKVKFRVIEETDT